ncbi:MAG: hypothetical protein ABFS22_11560 [Pseudomonadota bacterium]
MMNNSRQVQHKYWQWALALVIAGNLLATVQENVLAAEPQGKKIMEDKCTLCHDLPEPGKLSKEQWVVTLKEMAANAGLSKREKKVVLDYVTSHEKKALIAVSMAKERELFEQKCSLCHTTARVFLMPLTSKSRRHIVLRMQKRAPDFITSNEAHQILEYLNAGAPGADKPPARAPADGSPAAIFRNRCTVCHTAERVYLELQESDKKGATVVWGHVIKRMREKVPDWITEKEAKQILQYLSSLKPVKEE